MTRDEILNLPAGREMDVLVAKYVMEDPIYEFPPGMLNNLRPYSTDIAAAWQVVEKISISSFRFVINRDEGKEWQVMISGWSSGTTKVASGATAPLAICRAALLTTLEAAAHVHLDQQKSRLRR